MNSLRVLLVDDEEELVSAVCERLQLRDMETEGVTSGTDAIKRIQETEFDVVVLDVKMPGLGGFDVLRRIKQTKSDLPVVLLTGHGAEQEAEEGIRLGAYDYILKPVDIEALAELLRDATRQSGIGT